MIESFWNTDKTHWYRVMSWVENRRKRNRKNKRVCVSLANCQAKADWTLSHIQRHVIDFRGGRP